MKMNLESADTSNKLYTFLLIMLVMLFCIAVRFTWVYYFSNIKGFDIESFKWNDEFMVTTNDSYYFAEGAKDIIFCQKDNASMGEFYQKNCHQEFDRSPVHEPLSKITVLLYKILPFKMETIFFYMPAIFSAFIVIPIIIVARRFHMTACGVIAALLTGIGTSYYNRSSLGYYDTDMLTIFFPVLIFVSFALALKTQERKYIFLTGIALVAYRWWYPQGYTIELAFIGLAIIYVLIDSLTFEGSWKNSKKGVFYTLAKGLKFEGNKNFYYELFSIIFISMMWFIEFYGVAAVTLLFILICSKKLEKYNFYIALSAFILFVTYFILQGSTPVWTLVKLYIFRDSVLSMEGEVNLGFLSVMQTIIESSGKDEPFEILFREFAERISIYRELFIISMIGYIWLCIKKPVFLLMLPILGIGLLSYSKGIRFTMYAIPVASFGLAFLIVKIGEIIKTLFDTSNTKVAKYTSSIFIILATSLALYPTINYAYNNRAGPIFNKSEVALLEEFQTKSNREDYVVTWWDYGYPIRYYSDVKTLIDGGKHEGFENFPVSFILGNDQKSAANMARLEVEYTEKRFVIDRDNESLSSRNKTKIPSNNLAWMMQDYNFTNSNDFLLSLKTDIELPEKTRDIYFYLPFRMSSIFPTILRFSNRDLMSGQEFPINNIKILQTKDARLNDKTLFWISNLGVVEENDSNIVFNNGIAIDKKTWEIVINANDPTIGVNRFPLKRVVKAHYGQNNELVRDGFNIHQNGSFSLVAHQSYGTMIVDEKLYNSVYFQMFFLDNYDKNLFESVSSNIYAKMYKLKI